MYIPTRRSCLFILILAQILNVLGQVDECAVDTSPPETLDQENAEICTDRNKDEGDPEIGNAPNEIAALAANSSTPNTTIVNCLTDKVYGPVKIVNATRLMKLLVIKPGPNNRTRNDKESRQIPGRCVLVLFYARWCVFSSLAAPHFNALPRVFPYVKAIALDAVKHHSISAQYGIVGVPTLILIHNGKPVAKFNDTVYTIDSFARFVNQLTGLQPNGSLYVTSADFGGPIPSTPSNETDYCLVLSWIFIAACALYFTSQSRCWQQFVELIQNTWRESNAQHEHVE